MNSRHDTERGFTLMEVLVAFAILALSLGALYQLYGGSLTRLRNEAGHIEALRVAQATLAELGATRSVLIDMNESFISTDQRWLVRIMSVAPSEATSNPQGTWLVVRVSPNAPPAREGDPVTLTTYKLLSPP